MIEKSTVQKVLEVFFEYPSREFYLRELSRLLKLSMPTIISTTDTLSREKLIICQNRDKGQFRGPKTTAEYDANPLQLATGVRYKFAYARSHPLAPRIAARASTRGLARSYTGRTG